MTPRVQAALIVVALGLCPAVRAEPPTKVKPLTVVKDEAARTQEALARQFRDFEQSLLRLARRVDRQQAIQLKKAIELAGKENVDGRFDKLIDILRTSRALSVQEIESALEEMKTLDDNLRQLLAVLLHEGRFEELKAEQARLSRIILDLARAIRAEKLVRAMTEGNRTEKGDLARSQDRVTATTRGIARDMRGPGTGNRPAADRMPGRRQVERAVESEVQARRRIQEGDNPGASDNEDDAVRRLQDAHKKLEDILRQLRDEEIERVLAALQARCEHMLKMQTEVYEGTQQVDQAIGGKKATHADETRSLRLSDREREIVGDAEKAIQLLEAEGSAVAFPEVFTQVRDDMKSVSRRLGKADVGPVTQVIEQDIIATLKEMVAALKKAREDSSHEPPGNPSPKPPSPPKDPSLLEKVAELKMIRSMQKRVNSRTETYGDRYAGEQAADPEVRQELQELSARQKRIFRVTSDMYRGLNK
ncbi:MAG TPA: hypothetical protein VG013_16800 [Gemmataceae bacterium]|jgi:hypothetical protein|nr:hypothetical protein [Gemmataceae bacterium]